VAKVEAGEVIAWRVNLNTHKTGFDNPVSGYHEYGPKTWIDGDVVLFGSPRDSRAVADLAEFLRRVPSANYPSAGRFFVQYVWDAFLGGRHALYIGCRDADGAAAAVDWLARRAAAGPGAEEAPAVAEGGDAPVIEWAEASRPLENMLEGKVGVELLDVAFSPAGNRVFVTADSYGDSLFVLDPRGEVLHRRAIHNRCGNNLWFRGGGQLQPLDDDRVRVSLWNTDYLLSLDKGFVSRAVSPPSGLPGRIKVHARGDTLLRDSVRGRAYVGGARALHAVDREGRLVWTHDDAAFRSSTDDMLYPRSVFIRALSPDGAFLLCSAFGIQQDVYGIGTIRNASVFALDTRDGGVLWEKDGLVLNEGKAFADGERFVVVDDGGEFHLLNARSGGSGGAFRAVQGTDWILPVAGRDALLIVENNHFDSEGPTSRVYLRAPGYRPDIEFPIGGRLTDVAVAPDGGLVVLASERGRTAAFGPDGRARWEAATPAGGRLACAPDGQTVLLASREGTLHWLDMGDGRVLRSQDFNGYNVTSPEQFVAQLSSIGDVPAEQDVQVPPRPPEPSYLDSLRKDTVTFGANRLPADALRGALAPARPLPGDPARPHAVHLLERAATFSVDVLPGKTYLVEFLAGAADPGALTPQTRLEVSVASARKSRNLPVTGRLPLGARLERRRLAFRCDEQETVTLGLRVVRPTRTGEGRQMKMTYEPGEEAGTGVLLGDVVVASMSFVSRNLLLEQGPGSRVEPKGTVKCEIWPWRGGANLEHWWQYDAPKTSLRVTDGVIANQETSWHDVKDAPKGTGIDYANGWVEFAKPQMLGAVAVYEDLTGPVPSGD
jgi:outer membrane protein assembly factor BamB